MSLRHSSENLSVCTICRENVDADANSLRTACGHRFHKNCLVTWLKRSSSCPQCRAFCNGKDFGISQTPNRGARTRSRANTSANNIIIPTATGNDHSQTQHEVQSSNQVLAGNTPNILTEAGAGDFEGAVGGTAGMDDTRIRHIVSAVISARRASIFSEIEDRVTRSIEDRIESVLTNSLNRLNLNVQNNVPRSNNNSSAHNNNANYEWPQDTNRLSDLQQNMSFPNNSELRSSNSNVSNAGRIASLINNWDIKFDGSPKLSVENFIYRIESMVVDTLSGNFNVLCENAQCIFVNEAKDWY